MGLGGDGAAIMEFWLLKTEPESDYSFQDLAREKQVTWDGVNNNWALQHLRAMKVGDRAFVYHSGKDKHIAGIAEVARAAYPDPALEDARRVVVDLRHVAALPMPVTLAAVKANDTFADLLLVKMSRLSVMPVRATHWRKLREMGGLSSEPK
jgi:predicted RNA-binding protein with PUA-like domain